jgi:hypothetical protein
MDQMGQGRFGRVAHALFLSACQRDTAKSTYNRIGFLWADYVPLPTRQTY